MSDGTDENDQTGEGRKRRRSSEEDETETQMQEPPKKQRRRHSQTIARADSTQQEQQQQQQQQQLPVPCSIDIDDRRRESKETAVRILSEDMPQMISRLRDIFRRSEAAWVEKRLLTIAERQGSTIEAGPCSAPKRRELNREVKDLLDDATEFLERQQEPLKEEESDSESDSESNTQSNYESERMFSGDQLQALSEELVLLSEHLRQIHQTMSNEEKLHLKKNLQLLRFIIEHPTSYELQEQVDAPIDPPAPLHDTSELIELVEAEIRKAIELSNDLTQWIELHESPIPLATSPERDVSPTVLDVIKRGVEFCEAVMASHQRYITTRIALGQHTIQEPLPFERVRAVDSYDSVISIIWRRGATAMADYCVILIDFLDSQYHILGRSVPTENAAAAAAAVNHM